MKRAVCLLLLCLLCLSGCNVVRKTELLADVNFKNGFTVSATDTGAGAPVGIFDYGQNLTETDWALSQWWSKSNILDGTKEVLEDGVYKIYDSTKSVTIDTNSGILTSSVNTGEYSGGNWHHLLFEQGLGGRYVYTDSAKTEQYRLKDMQELHFNGTFELLKTEVTTGVSQYIIYLNIQNLNRESPDFGKLLHFGLPIYDSRYIPRDYIPAYEAQDFAMQNGNFIYSISNRVFFKKPFNANGEEYIISKDFLPYIKTAFERAQKKKFFQNSSFDDMFLGSVTIGWETPGEASCEIKASNLRIYSVN